MVAQSYTRKILKCLLSHFNLLSLMIWKISVIVLVLHFYTPQEQSSMRIATLQAFSN